jgi:hypothetical protein
VANGGSGISGNMAALECNVGINIILAKWRNVNGVNGGENNNVISKLGSGWRLAAGGIISNGIGGVM